MCSPSSHSPSASPTSFSSPQSPASTSISRITPSLVRSSSLDKHLCSVSVFNCYLDRASERKKRLGTQVYFLNTVNFTAAWLRRLVNDCQDPWPSYRMLKFRMRVKKNQPHASHSNYRTTTRTGSTFSRSSSGHLERVSHLGSYSSSLLKPIPATGLLGLSQLIKRDV